MDIIADAKNVYEIIGSSTMPRCLKIEHGGLSNHKDKKHTEVTNEKI